MRNKFLWDCFEIHYDEESNTKWICFDKFIAFLKEKLTSQDRIKKIRPDNILRSLKQQQNSIRLTERKVLDAEGNVITVCNHELNFVSFLKFCFNHINDLEICKKICNQVQECSLDDSDSTDSLYNFYLTVSKTIFRLDQLDKLLTNSVHDIEIPCLFQAYETSFLKDEWERIKIFENYFWQTIEDSSDYDRHGYSGSHSVSKRWEVFEECKLLSSVKPSLLHSAKKTVKTNNDRKLAVAKNDGILIQAITSHVPDLLDVSVNTVLGEHFPGVFQHAVCLDCNHICTKRHGECRGIHIYLELSRNVINFNFEDVYTIVNSEIKNEHRETCLEIAIFSNESFTDYIEEGTITKRFSLRDAISKGQLFHRLVFSHYDHDVERDFDDNCCPTCTPVLSHNDPLDFRTFDIHREWKYHVPLPFQILLETFINAESARRSDAPEKFMKAKLDKLHMTFDSLLNTSNKLYVGHQQELNTDQLSASYHNVCSVFSVTSHGGLTSSLTCAGNRLQRQAEPDKCYYNTFLKKYELDICSDDSSQNTVSLQDCHIIFCLDNLVRLSFHRDPDRGESRSSQLCTLPMTLMGIPRHHPIIETWHDPNICDGTSECKCKEKTTLSQDDLEFVFHHLTDDEQTQKDKLHSALAWSHHFLWENIQDSEVAPYLKRIVQRETTYAEPDENHEEWQSSYNLKLDEILFKINMESELMDQTMSDTSSSHTGMTDDELCFNDEDNDLVDLNESLVGMSLGCTPFQDDSSKELEMPAVNPLVNQEDSDNVVVEDSLSTMGFTVFKPPCLLVRHPPPAIGRDDDINKLREILDETLIKSGNYSDTCRILFAPDNKIGKSLFILMKENDRFKRYLPEFPLLHLRKSKIGNLCSAYKDAGLYHLIGYMQDANLDWSNIVSAENIEDATHHIRRISYSLHIAFLIKFMESKPKEEACQILHILQCPDAAVDAKLKVEYKAFIAERSSENATFALHVDLLVHCDEILAIAIAERIGGEDGYNLLLATVKESLPFSFLNGASSYGAFCCQLLYHHYSSGFFHQKFKKTLYSNPFKGSKSNFALDTQREMEHRDALKGFRPRSTVTAVLPRLSLVDRFLEMESCREEERPSPVANRSRSRTWCISKQDMKHIFPTAALILKQGGLDIQKDDVPRNVYSSKPTRLPETALDKTTFHVGRYLIDRYVFQSDFHDSTSASEPVLETASMSTIPEVLMKKVKTMKGVTIRRMTLKSRESAQGPDAKEIKRKNRVKSLVGIAECMTSDMNTCQALVKPDCSKTTVQKSMGMKKALTSLLCKLITSDQSKEEINLNCTQTLKNSNLAHFGIKEFEDQLMTNVSVSVVELAGIKFKARASTGEEYLKIVEGNVIKRVLRHIPTIQHMVICEEKYKFTPDDFKASTRMNRKKQEDQSISHLKRGDEIINMSTFDKKAITSTDEGKSEISSFLAKHITRLDIKRDFILDIDSEWITDGCTCENANCKCTSKYSVPTRVLFDPRGLAGSLELQHIQQRKGEAEMAQVDWLIHMAEQMKPCDEILSIVTSGDIDAIPIHLFSLSLLWPRRDDGTFKNHVHVALQKPGSMDIYNVTSIIELLEKKLGNDAGMKVAIGLCMGGNDYIPKYHGMSHEKILATFVNNPMFFNNIVGMNTSQNRGQITKPMYQEMIKHIYCPNGLDANKLTYEEVRQLTIKHPQKNEFSRPQKWLPPKSALEQVCHLLEYQLEYLFMAGHHSAKLPNFLEKGCLRKNLNGAIEYYLGTEVKVNKAEELLKIPEATLLKRVMDCKLPRQLKERGMDSQPRKRTLADTPQRGARRKQRQMTSTPRK